MINHLALQAHPDNVWDSSSHSSTRILPYRSAELNPLAKTNRLDMTKPAKLVQNLKLPTYPRAETIQLAQG